MIGIEFVTAGKATFTVDNGQGKHYTFRVEAPKEQHADRPIWFVKLLTGSDNEHDYTYLGLLVTNGPGYALRATGKSPRALVDGTPGKAFAFALRLVCGLQAVPAGYDVKHDGRCGRCGRTLTVPSSIDMGIGPDCAEMMSRAA